MKNSYLAFGRASRTLIVGFALVMFFFQLKAQNPTYLCELRNDVQVDATTYEFDIYLLRTGSTVFELAAIQHGIYINSGIIPAGGVLTAAIVAGSSELSGTNIPSNANISIANSNPNKTIKITGNAYPGSGSGSIISEVSPGTRYARIRVTCSLPFVALSKANLIWSFSNPPSWPSKVQAYVSGLPVNITVQAGHTNVNLVNPFLNPPIPTAFAVTGGGAYCAGGTGLPVGVENTEVGVSYELWLNNVATGIILPGTGAAISFGDKSAGVYTVKGTNVGGTTDMTGSAIITEDPATVGGAVTGGTTINSGQTSGLLTLAGHTGAVVKWQSSVNDGANWSDIVNTGATYTSEPLTQTTWFRAVVQSGSCGAENAAHTVVTVTTAPVAYNLSGSGSYCQGGAGLTITLDGSEAGVSYQLYKGAIAVGAPLVGTGANLTWTNQTAGSYTVVGANGAMATTTMNGTVVISETPNLPVSVTLAADANNVCAGTSVEFTATPMNGGISPSYAWYVNSTLMTSGSPATYTYVPVNGDQVHVILTSSETCTAGNPATSATVVMVVNPLIPVSVTVAADANPVCAGTTVNFTATPANGGVTPAYQWYVNGFAVGADLPTHSYVPADGDLVHVVMTSSEACTTGNPATSSDVVMVVNPILPVSVSLMASVNPSCEGGEVLYQATPHNGGVPAYQWYVNNNPAGAGLANFFYTPQNGDQIKVEMTSSEVCKSGSPATSNIVSAVVKPFVVPSVTISPDANPVCATVPVTFTASPTNGGITPAYMWFVNDVWQPGSTAIFSYVPANNDVVLAELIPSADVCVLGSATSNAITMNVLASTAASVTLSSSANPVCPGIPVTITATPVVSGSLSYKWFKNSIEVLGEDLDTYTYTPADGDQVYCQVTSDLGCSVPNPVSSAPMTITVLPSNAASVTIAASANPSCGSEIVSCTATPVHGGTPSYQWLVNNLPVGLDQDTYAYAPLTGDVVKVNMTSTEACVTGSPATSNEVTQSVTVPVVLSVSISPDAAAVCTGTGVIYTATAVNGGEAPHYQWYKNNVAVGLNQATYSFIPVNGDQVYVELTAIECNTGMATSALSTMVVNPLPVPTIEGAVNSCLGETGVVYTTEAGMSAYSWTISGGTITAGQGTNSITVTWDALGVNKVTVIYTNANNCTPTLATNYTVNVYARPLPTVSGPASAGVGTSQVYTTEAGMSNYVWTVSAGGTITAGGTLLDNTATVLWNTAGNQNVTVNYNNANNCPASAATQYDVTVFSTPGPAGSITGTSSVCAGAAGVAYSVDPILNATGYVWTLPVGATIASGSNTNSITVDFSLSAVSGVVTVYGTNTYGNGTVSPDYSVTVNQLPVPVINGDNSVCEGTASVTYTTEAGMTGYTWSVPAGGTIIGGAGTNQIDVLWITVGGPWSVLVNYTNGNGCTATTATDYPVMVYPLSYVEFTGLSDNYCISDSPVVLTGNMAPFGTFSGIGVVDNANGTATFNPAVAGVGGPYEVRYSYISTNACQSDTSVFTMVHPLPVPTITGAASVCVGTTGVVYTTEAGMGAYNWTISTGGTITAGAGTNQITVTWTAAGPQAVNVSYANANNCTAATALSVTVNPLPVPVITGNNNVCNGATGVVYTTEAGMTGYNWTVSAGGTITAGTGTNQIAVTWTTNGAQSVSVNYTNSNNCTALNATSYPVTVNALPAPTITGNNSVCVGTTGVVYTTQAGQTAYAWTVSAGGTITAGAGTNAITVTWNTTGAQSVGVNYTNASNCTAATATAYPVTVNARPTPTITGPVSACVATTGHVYSTQAGQTAYAWTVSAGGTITAGAGTNAITVSWNTAGAQTVGVNYNNASNCAAVTPASYAVTVNALPVPVITGPATPCIGSTGNIYSTQAGMTGYVWTVSAGGTITAGSGTSAITVTWTTSGPKTVTVNYVNGTGCTALAPASYAVTVGVPANPTISGNTGVCLNSGLYPYETEAGMTGYTWTVSTGGVITSGQGTNQVVVNWTGAGAQSVNVNYIPSTGCPSPTPTALAVTVTGFPANAGAITGTPTVCAGTNGVQYSVSPVNGATEYVWNLPAGATIASGLTTNVITVDFGAAAVSGNITVYGANVCGSGAASPAYAVAVNSLPAAAGTISGTAAICAGSTGVVYTVAAISSATGYTWTVPAGASIVAGNNTNSITVDWSSSSTGGAITVYGTNACGNGVTSPAYAVTVNPIPATPVITWDGSVLTSSSATGNQWYVDGVAVAGATGQTYIPAVNGVYYVVVTLNGCSSAQSNTLITYVGIADGEAFGYQVYPVPNKGQFTVSVTGVEPGGYILRVQNAVGQTVYETSAQTNGTIKEELNLSWLPSGLYNVGIVTGQHAMVRKIIVNK